MEGFNKILSLFIGLFVVIIIGFLLVKRFNLQTSWPILGGNTSVITPTSTPKSNTKSGVKDVVIVNNTAESLKEKFGTAKKTGDKTTTITTKQTTSTVGGYASTDTQTQKGVIVEKTTPSQIPETGLPTAFMPLLFSGLFGGVYLKRKS